MSANSASSTANQQTAVYDPDLWRKGYADCKEEMCELLEGYVPEDLVGTYYRYFLSPLHDTDDV